MSSPEKKYLRPAVIVSTDPAGQTCRIKMIDYPSIKEFVCTMPHPMASTGWGIFAVPTVGTRVYVSYISRERPRIVSIIPLNQFSLGDFEVPDEVANVCVDESEYPALKPGELALQGISGANMVINSDGNIKFHINNSSIEYNGSLETSMEAFSNKYTITEGSRIINGIIRRDIRARPTSPEKTQDKLISLQPEFRWADIGRNPNFEVQKVTVDDRDSSGNAQLSIVRNPALVENRTLIYEYALSDATQAYEVERELGEGVTDDTNNNQVFFDKNRRELSRVDVLNLGLHFPNNLIERIEGTVVDYYGNILDINRNIINFSNIRKREGGQDADQDRLKAELSLLRRSIKYHFELNTKKEVTAEQITPVDQSGSSTPILDALGADGASTPDEALRTGYSHSRFSIDVDGEGFTKINIPSSSNQGNIPYLSRYINSFDPKNRNAGDFRDPTRRDIRHMGFGKPSIDIVGKDYVPENILEDGSQLAAGTAYHDLISLASDLGSGPYVNDTIINDIDNPNANAGGRSLHLNLDGSMEMNIGRDVIDKKSVVIDTAGSIMSMIGRDANDNSIISQIDGNIKVQVGGSSTPGDEELPENVVEIIIKTNIGQHSIRIDSTAMRFFSEGNMVFNAKGNIAMNAGGEALINGSGIFMYGSASDDGALVKRKRYINPNGEEMK